MTGNTDAQGGRDAAGAAVPAAVPAADGATRSASAATGFTAGTNSSGAVVPITDGATGSASAGTGFTTGTSSTVGTRSTTATVDPDRFPNPERLVDTNRLADLGTAAELEPHRRAAFDEPGGPPPLKDWPGLDDGPAARPEVPSVPGLPGVPQVPSEVLASSSALIPRMGQPGRYKWAFSAIWLVYLVGPLVQAVQADESTAWKVATFVVVGLFSALYVALSHLARSGARRPTAGCRRHCRPSSRSSCSPRRAASSSART